ncbi:hypothetical protein [Priestia sp. GS2]|uniref:hypothetical protein n=1 Tax=Priestia sp. GS2 TaxID=3117403 RepID=UPI002ED94DF5
MTESYESNVAVAMLDNKADCYEPENGQIAVPAPKGTPRYNLTKMYEYCLRENKNPKALTEVEKKMFQLPNKRR